MPRRLSAAIFRMPLVALMLLAAAAAACASGRTPAAATAAGDEAPTGRAGHPLAGLAGERVVIVPTQRLRVADSSVASLDPSGSVAYLQALDSAVSAAVSARGVPWALPDDVVRSARNNPSYSPDVHRLAIGELLPGRARAKDGTLRDPLASQLRTIVALNDARYVLVPSELRVEHGAAGTSRAMLRVALVDARAGELRWTGDVAGDVTASGTAVLSSAAAATLAARLADLIAAR